MILERGSSPFERLGSPSLEVFHCWELPYEDALRHSPFVRISEEDLRTRLEGAEAKHAERFNRAVEDFRDRERTVVTLLKGNPSEVIPEKVRKDEVDFVVMGTFTQMGIQGLFIGNTAEAILTEADCSVLTVKPDGFVNPVAPSKDSS